MEVVDHKHVRLVSQRHRHRSHMAERAMRKLSAPAWRSQARYYRSNERHEQQRKIVFTWHCDRGTSDKLGHSQ